MVSPNIFHPQVTWELLREMVLGFVAICLVPWLHLPVLRRATAVNHVVVERFARGSVLNSLLVRDSPSVRKLDNTSHKY